MRIYCALAATALVSSFASCASQPSEADSDAAHQADGGITSETDGQAEPGVGLRAVYYDGYAGDGVVRTDEAIDFDWDSEAPMEGVGANHFAVRWTGAVDIAEAGRYGFQVQADDGVRLWIDGTRILDEWRPGSQSSDWVEVDLAAGLVDLKLTYFEEDGPAKVRLRWRRPDGTEEVVPAEFLRPPVDETVMASPLPPYENPVSNLKCADPGVIQVDDWYYLSCTGGRFRIKRSRDLVHWKNTNSYILPAGGAPWSASTMYRWAPEFHKVGNKIIAYFTAADGNGQKAVGAASADDILGPYTQRNAPLVTDPIGVIDPNFFQDDDGTNYFLWKLAGTGVGQPTPIYIREMGPGALGFAAGSSKIELIRNQPATWEGSTTEAPWLIKRGNFYYLFYSGNAIDARYRVGVARATSVTGPYTKLGSPILGNNSKWVGPGHQAITQVDGVDYLVYHAWGTTPNGSRDTDRGRLLMVDRIDWSGGWPHIEDDGTPSMSLRPGPGVDPDAD